MAEMGLVTLGDILARGRALISGPFGSNISSKFFVRSGIPVIRGNNLTSGMERFVDEGFVFVTPAKADELRADAFANDLIFTAAGTIGQVGIIPTRSKFDRYIISNKQIRARIDKEKVDPLFAFYWFSAPESIRNIQAHNTGSTIPLINLSVVRNLPIYLPSLKAQKQIVQVLGSLDDKIELNRRTNETLEAMAQAIFRDWFVDFGPVRRKMDGATDPVAIMGGLTPDPVRAAELAALFPAGMDGGGLPEGWTERPLDQIAEFLNGLALQKFPPVDGSPNLPVIKIAELRSGVTDKSGKASALLPDRYIVRDGDYLFSWSGSLMAKVWTGGDGALNQHLFKVTSTGYPQWFYAAWVEYHLPDFQRIAASKATTMGHIQRGHLASAMTVCPSSPTLEAMGAVLGPLWERRIHNDLESRTLAETRDYLLPRLMSGEVRVGDRESMVA